MDKKITINLSSGNIIKAIVLVILAWVLFFLKDVVLVVLTSIVIASAVDPGVRYLVSKKIPRIVGVIIIYGILAFFILGIILFVIPTFLSETSGLIEKFPVYLSQINNYIPLLDESFLQGYVPLIKEIAGKVGSLNIGIDSVSNKSDFIAQAGAVFTGALNALLIFVLSFYFSVIQDSITSFLRIITPTKHEGYVLDLWKRTKEKIGAWMQGQLLLGALVGFLIYTMLAILGVKHAFLLAVLAGFFEIIPVFGPILAAIPAVILALLDRGFGQGVVILGWYIVVQQLENNLFYPLVVKKIVGVSPLIVILAFIVGGKLAGFLGVLLSVPMSVLLMEFVDDLDKKKSKSNG